MAGLSSLQRSTFSKISERKSSAYLLAISPTGDVSTTPKPLRFQYYPDTISDSKAVNWTEREIPGGGLPIYQWISSGARSLSFTAVFTSDMDLLAPDTGESLGERLKNVGQLGRNPDIRSAIAWLRYFMIPSFGNPVDVGVPLAQAPSRLKLILPGTGIGISGGTSRTLEDKDEILCVMTQCDVTYEALFPSGYPRVVTAALAFAQIAQLADSGAVVFPDANNMIGQIEGSGTPGGPFGYKLEIETRNGRPQ